jgi:hypothetical protein
MAGSSVPARILKHWHLSGISTWRSGLPLNVISGRDQSFTGLGTDWADRVGGQDPKLPDGRQQAEKVRSWFNTRAFTFAAPGTFGSAGRNSFRGPSRFNLDIGLARTFHIGETLRLHFRGEAFNSLNHTQLSNPAISVNSPVFGQINAADDPRVLQFAIKLTW